MLTDIDCELYPDDCEVVEIPPHDLRVLCILKNGSITLKRLAQQQGFRVYQSHQLAQLDRVDILIRDPRQRYVSGVDMYVKTLLEHDPTLDAGTCLWFATRYDFLNRHFLPQFHALVNLARFVSPQCSIRFHDFDLLARVTDIDDKPTRQPLDPDTKSLIESKMTTKESWFFLDDVLMGLRGQTLTWAEIKQIFQQHPGQPWQKFQTALTIGDVLR